MYKQARLRKRPACRRALALLELPGEADEEDNAE
jgi:hypothetical protein